MFDEEHAKLEELAALVKKNGGNLVAVIAHYEPHRGGAHFSTKISTQDNPEVPLDHAIMDCVREISDQWSEIAHPREDAEPVAA